VRRSSPRFEGIYDTERMPLTLEIIDEAVTRYRREYDRHLKLSEFVAAKCRRIVEDNAIRATVQWRAKDPRGLDLKLRKYLADDERRHVFDSVDDVFEKIKDLAGVRITTYVENDRSKAVSQVEAAFAGPGDDHSAVTSEKDSHQSFYRATHCQVILQEDELVGAYENLERTSCEIQVCSLLAHVWNEIEHDLGYKPLTGELSAEEEQALESLGQITQGGDGIINGLLMANERRLAQTQGEFLDVHDFVVRMRDSLSDVPDFSANSGQLYEELLALGLNTPGRIAEALFGEDPSQTSLELAERLKHHLEERQDEVVSVDPGSSDRLLMLLLLDRAQAVIERHPAGRGQGRPPRIASVARRFLEMS
jgi:ppGpp synthetase/RelA/SpoT-type nucleotidyltranferase